MDIDDSNWKTELSNIIDNLKQELYELNDNTLSGSDPSSEPFLSPYKFFLDGDSFKFTKGFCYIVLENMTSSPIEYQIQVYNRTDFDMMDEITQK